MKLTNEDLAPVAAADRTWSTMHFAALWVGMAVCIPTYTLASGLIDQGMSWWQALLTVALGNVIVLVPMVLNAHAGTKYGIPFPVFARASFGVLGANVPALLRALVACGWFGIQTWFGGLALYQLWFALRGEAPPGPEAIAAAKLALLGATPGQLFAYLLFWCMNLFFILRGTESIKWLETLAAPFLLAAGLALLAWARIRAGSFGEILGQPSKFQTSGQFFAVFAPGLTAMVGFWATLSLNIPDFTRYAKSQRDQALGQAIGLPGTMLLFSFIGVAVTSATPLIFPGEPPIWDPVVLIGRVGGAVVTLVAMLALSVATLSTNLAANVVSPANDFSNLAPERISYRAGGVLTAVIGTLIMPWKLLETSGAYIFTWLVGYSALLGPIGGIMIADYFLVRRRELAVDDLYRRGGAYEYSRGWHGLALAALAIGAGVNLPGFLLEAIPSWKEGFAARAAELVAGTAVATGGDRAAGFFRALYDYAWFIGFFLAGGIYWAGMTLRGGVRPAQVGPTAEPPPAA